MPSSTLAGVKLTPSQRKDIIRRYAKYAKRKDGTVDENLALYKARQRQVRVQKGLKLGEGDQGEQSRRAARARALGALGGVPAPVVFSRPPAVAPPTSITAPGPRVRAYGMRGVQTKGGPAGGKPVTDAYQQTKRKRAIGAMVRGRR